MMSQTHAYYTARRNGHLPIFLAEIESSQGVRLVGLTAPESRSMAIWDGSLKAGDGGVFGRSGYIATLARIAQFGSFAQRLNPADDNLIASMSQAELPSYSISLDDTDGYFANLISGRNDEVFLSYRLTLIQGFIGLDFTEYQTIFTGIISDERLTDTEYSLTVTPNLQVTRIGEANLSVLSDDSVLVYTLQCSDIGAPAAQTNIAFDRLSSVFFSSENWTFQATFSTSNLQSVGSLFRLIGSAYDLTRLNIGIASDNSLTVSIGNDIDTSGPITIFATTQIKISEAQLNTPLDLKVVWNEGSKTVTFSLTGFVDETISVLSEPGSGFDRVSEGAGYDSLQIGAGFAGEIKSLRFGNTWYVHNDNDATATTLVDSISALNIPLDTGTWETWSV